MSAAGNSDNNTALPALGFLGVGRMGGPMARNLLTAGYSVTAYDPDPARLAACAAAGAAVAASAATVIREGDVVLLSLRASMFANVAEQVLLPNASAGQVFIDMGTTEAHVTRRVASALREKDAVMLDAPVSGGESGSEAGILHIFVGGDEEVYERSRPILELLGEPEHVVYCGPSGCGQIAKGVNQLAMGLANAAYLEAIAFGVRAGVNPAAILQAVGGSSGWRQRVARFATMVEEGRADDVYTKFPELPYFLREAREQGFDLSMTEALFTFCDAGPRDWVDNMGRPRVSYWHEIITRPRRELPEDDT